MRYDGYVGKSCHYYPKEQALYWYNETEQTLARMGFVKNFRKFTKDSWVAVGITFYKEKLKEWGNDTGEV